MIGICLSRPRKFFKSVWGEVMGVPFAYVNDTASSIKSDLEEILRIVQSNPDDLFEVARCDLLESCKIISDIFIAAQGEQEC